MATPRGGHVLFLPIKMPLADNIFFYPPTRILPKTLTYQGITSNMNLLLTGTQPVYAGLRERSFCL